MNDLIKAECKGTVYELRVLRSSAVSTGESDNWLGTLRMGFYNQLNDFRSVAFLLDMLMGMPQMRGVVFANDFFVLKGITINKFPTAEEKKRYGETLTAIATIKYRSYFDSGSGQVIVLGARDDQQ